MTGGSLEVSNLSVRFGGLWAIADVSLSIAPGERVGLIGPNGAGKTTFVNTVSGEITPERGEVVIAGNRATRLKPHQRFRLGLARTFQVAHPFPALSVLDAVMLGPLSKGASTERAAQAAVAALRSLDREADASRAMRDLNPVTAKLVELARIVASDPAVVFLDELLAGLLPTERQDVLSVLTQLSGDHGWATVMIEHLIGDVRQFCNRVVVLDQGQVIADGSTEVVLADPRVIEAYLGDPHTVEDHVSTRGRDGVL